MFVGGKPRQFCSTLSQKCNACCEHVFVRDKGVFAFWGVRETLPQNPSQNDSAEASSWSTKSVFYDCNYWKKMSFEKCLQSKVQKKKKVKHFRNCHSWKAQLLKGLLWVRILIRYQHVENGGGCWKGLDIHESRIRADDEPWRYKMLHEYKWNASLQLSRAAQHQWRPTFQPYNGTNIW